MSSPFKQADVRTLRNKGFTTAHLPHNQLLTRYIETAFRGLEEIYADETLCEIFLSERSNKDHGRLLPGGFENRRDLMRQINFGSFGDGVFDHHIKEAGRPDLRKTFEALETINNADRMLAKALADEIDTFAARLDEYSLVPLAPLVEGATVITSATTYRAQSGSDITSAQTNTAGFGIYRYADNEGMYIVHPLGEAMHDVSGIESDPQQALIVPGEELALVLRGFIGAARNPIFPKRDGDLRSTMRTFVYFDQRLIVGLKEKHNHEVSHLSRI